MNKSTIPLIFSAGRLRRALGSVTIAATACGGPLRTTADQRIPVSDGGRLASVILHARVLGSYDTLIEALRGHVPSMRVRTGPDCPHIVLRNGRPPGHLTAPLVYVDGTRAVGTCDLLDIVPSDVERVEVYPNGITTRPGYGRSSNGLILIFLKGG